MTVCVTCHEKVLSSRRAVTQFTSLVGSFMSSFVCLEQSIGKFTVTPLHLHHSLKQSDKGKFYQEPNLMKSSDVLFLCGIELDTQIMSEHEQGRVRETSQ